MGRKRDSTVMLTEDSSFTEQSSLEERAIKSKKKNPVVERPNISSALLSNGKSIFDYLHDTQKSINAIGADWCRLYDLNAKKGMLCLLNSLGESSGCEDVILMSQYTKEPCENILQLFEVDYRLATEGGQYPIMKGKKGEKFQYRLLSFWASILNQTTGGALHEPEFLDEICEWLARFSESTFRPIRHTATLIALQVTSTLVEINKTLRSSIEAARKHDGKGKGRRSSNMERIELTAKSEALEEVIEMLYKEIFSVRYRDVVPEIRQACLEGLGQWVCGHSRFFLADEHMKYLGWCLADKSGMVRLEAIRSLYLIYSNPEFLSSLRVFTQHFKKQMCDAVLDKDASVAIEAIRLASLLSDHDILEATDYETIYKLLFDEQGEVRQMAAKFVYNYLLEGSSERSKAAEQLRGLIAFMDSYTRVPNYAVDAMWKTTNIFTDWKCMAGLLHAAADSMSDRQRILFARLVNVSARKATGHAICKKTKKEMAAEGTLKPQQVQKAMDALGEVMSYELPDLLKLYTADQAVLGELVELPRFMSLAGYDNKEYEDLLNRFQYIMLNMTEDDVLSRCAATLAHLMNSSDRGTETELKMRSIRMGLDEQLQPFRGISVDSWEELSDDERSSMELALKRARCLLSACDVSDLDVFELCADVIDWSTEYAAEIPMATLSTAFKAMYLNATWNLVAYDNDEGNDETLAGRILTQRDSLVKRSVALLNCNRGQLAVVYETFLVTCDMLVMFKMGGAGGSVALEAVPGELESRLLQAFTFLLRHFREGVTNIDKEDKAAMVVAGLARLVKVRAVSRSMGASVLFEFVLNGKVAEHVVKELLGHLRTHEDGGFPTWKLIFKALKWQFQHVLKASKEDQEVELERFKQLTNRLARSYGVGAVANRDELCFLVQKGISFGFKSAPDNFAFFDAMRRMLGALNSGDTGAGSRLFTHFQEQKLACGLDDIDPEAEYADFYFDLLQELLKLSGEEIPSGDMEDISSANGKRSFSEASEAPRKKKMDDLSVDL